MLRVIHAHLLLLVLVEDADEDCSYDSFVRLETLAGTVRIGIFSR